MELKIILKPTIWLQKVAVQTILQTKSSGPNGWAGLEYKKCLEYWDKWKQIMWPDKSSNINNQKYIRYRK